MTAKSLLLATLCLVAGVPYTIASAHVPPEPYAPYTTTCQGQAQPRVASSLGFAESAYTQERQRIADQQLKQWLEKTLDDESFCGGFDLPRIALALSGGGPKAGLTTAGVVQALDSRDSSNGVSGLLQSMTYISALSGGSLTLSGLMVNDFAKISVLKQNLYDVNYLNPYVLPLQKVAQIEEDVNAKHDAGYRTSTVDLYGRAISYDFIGGTEGGNGLTWSNVTTLPSFVSREAPYPIITLTDTDVPQGQCFPNFTGPIWEFAPYEFGSWDPSVDAFFPTKYLGTPEPSSNGGWGSNSGQCTEGFDNAGFFTGISSDTFPAQNEACFANGTEKLSSSANLVYVSLPAKVEQSPFGIVPNPFYNDSNAGVVRQRQYLYMQDGGYTGQVIPIFPFLQPERGVEVIFVIDAESSSNNVTDGSSLYNTYKAAQMVGLPKMPEVPTSQTFVAQNLSSRAQFFGCNDSEAATLIFIPNTYESAYASLYFWTPESLNAVFQGGIEMATQANDSQWPTCVACAIVHKQREFLPDVCTACLEKYCYNA